MLFLNACAKKPMLKSAYKKCFLIGAAMNSRQIDGSDHEALVIIEHHFNSITAENAMKWDALQPKQGVFDFQYSDRFINYGCKHDMFIIGHVLIWGHRTPEWVFKNKDGEPEEKALLIEKMRTHIQNVVGRYKGLVSGWDVVNEAIDADGQYRQNRWFKKLGEDYIVKAFQFAREADPGAELYYNDFSLPSFRKRKGVVAMVKKLRDKGVRIDGIGMQGHYGLNYPELKDLEESIREFAQLGLKVMISELDISMDRSISNAGQADGVTSTTTGAAHHLTAESLSIDDNEKLAQRYADLFSIFIKHSDKISRVTFWGVHDKQSWLNNRPVKGQNAHPLLFGRDYQPKPAFGAVIEAGCPR